MHPNFLSNLPTNILISCITGSSRATESDLYLFIRPNIVFTCHDLCKKINLLLPKLFRTIYSSYKEFNSITPIQRSQICSLRFISNWIKDKRVITQSSQVLTLDKIKQFERLSLTQSIPIVTTSEKEPNNSLPPPRLIKKL